MEQEKYKGQVIQFEILRPSVTRHWTGKRKFNTTTVEHLVRFFNVEGISEKFDSRDEAEQYVVEAAKKLIDSLT